MRKLASIRMDIGFATSDLERATRRLRELHSELLAHEPPKPKRVKPARAPVQRANDPRVAELKRRVLDHFGSGSRISFFNDRLADGGRSIKIERLLHPAELNALEVVVTDLLPGATFKYVGPSHWQRGEKRRKLRVILPALG